MGRTLGCAAIVWLGAQMPSIHAAPLTLASPDGKLTVSVNAQPEPAYSVTWNGNPLITTS
jgi:hypothetical protein